VNPERFLCDRIPTLVSSWYAEARSSHVMPYGS
jgi:hypothetical protein